MQATQSLSQSKPVRKSAKCNAIVDYDVQSRDWAESDADLIAIVRNGGILHAGDADGGRFTASTLFLL